MKKKHVIVIADQGNDANDRTFGYVCLSGNRECTGWFFTWPGDIQSGIRTVAEREAMIDSLDLDQISGDGPEIPHRWARIALNAYLRENFDLRRKN